MADLLRSRLARFSRGIEVAALVVVLLASPAAIQAGSGKAKKLYEQSRKAELQKDYASALELAEQAMLEDPKDHRYELAVRRLRFAAGQAHVDAGRRLREQGHLEEAAAQFQRAVELDPASTVAAQQLKRTLDLIGKRDGSADAGDDVPASAVERNVQQRTEMVDSLKEPPALKPVSTHPIDVTMSEQSKVVFETIGKLAGINVLFDSDFQDKKIDIEIQRATLVDALDYVSLIAKKYWKPITSNAIFVTDDNANKRREYEEEVVKTIYLNNVATPQELQEITTAIRGLTDIRRMFPVSSMNALILRGTAAKLALAEKVIHDIDKARPEVVIDVLVLEASKSKTREFGFSPVSGGGNGVSLPVNFNRGGESATGLPLNQIGNVGSSDWVTTLPGGQLTALFNASDTNLLQSPRIRASDNQQASLRIGDRIPIATGSFQPGIGGVGINPLVNTQFQYTDVGVNVDIQPKVHNDREVSMHVEIEISNVRAFQDIGGIQQPIIGQRTIQHDIRLEEGEASILGGLNQSQVFKTRSGVPFLGEIPLIGKLFSIEKVEAAENEILVVLIPHIVRLPTIEDSNLKAVASGTDQVFTVGFTQEPNGETPLQTAGVDRHEEPSATPAAQVSAQPTPAEPAPAEPAPAQPTPVEPTQSAEPVPTPAEPAAPAQNAPADLSAATSAQRLALIPASATVGVDQEVVVSVRVENGQQLFGVPLRIRYDREKLSLLEVVKGAFLAGPEATDLIFSRNIRDSVGQAAVNISRFPGTGGADGSGELVTLRFKGLAPGAAQVSVSPLGARNAEQQAAQVAAAQINLTIAQ